MIVNLKVLNKITKTENVIGIKIDYLSSRDDLVKYIMIPIVDYAIQYVDENSRSIVNLIENNPKEYYIMCSKCKFKLNIYNFCKKLGYEKPNPEDVITHVLHHYVYKHILHQPKYVYESTRGIHIFDSLMLTSKHVILESIDEPETWLLVISRKVFEKNRDRIRKAIFEIETNYIFENVKEYSIRTILTEKLGLYFRDSYDEICPKCGNELFTRYYDEYDYDEYHKLELQRKIPSWSYIIDLANRKIKVIRHVEEHFTVLDKDRAQCHYCGYTFSKNEIINKVLAKIYTQINDFVEKLYEIYISLKK